MVQLLWMSIGAAAAAFIILAALLWWFVPKLQMRPIVLGDPKARADIEDNFRKTVGQALGGIAVLAGAGVAYLQFLQQQQAARELLISNQVAKGFEQMGQSGSDKIVLRLGGIYALEGVMNGSAEYHGPVLEALSAYVRNGTKAHEGDNPPDTDIQAVLRVISRRNVHAVEAVQYVDLRDVRIPRANLGGAHLRNADLTGADLTGANLIGADLTGADVTHANLMGAKLTRVDLTTASLRNADLTDADLVHANLSGAHLRQAHLTGADLYAANLRNADLTRADLSGAKGVEQLQLDQACGEGAKLPSGLALKPCPKPPFYILDEDCDEKATPGGLRPCPPPPPPFYRAHPIDPPR